MKRPPAYWLTAKKTLSKKDPVLRKVIKKFVFLEQIKSKEIGYTKYFQILIILVHGLYLLEMDEF